MSSLIPFRKNSISRSKNYLDFYNLMDDFFNDDWLPSQGFWKDHFKIDIQETENYFTIEAELPGIKKENIHLNIDENNLTISVKQEEEVKKEEKNYVHRERRLSSMSRNIRLQNADLDQITAKLENGILVIHVPKDQQNKFSKRIDIQ